MSIGAQKEWKGDAEELNKLREAIEKSLQEDANKHLDVKGRKEGLCMSSQRNSKSGWEWYRVSSTA